MTRCLLLLTASSLALMGCNSGGDEAPRTVERESAQQAVDPDSREFIDFDTMQRPVPQQRPQRDVQKRSQPAEPATPLDSAIPVEGQHFTDVMFLDDASLLERRDIIKFEACNHGERDYHAMSKNEFSFETYLNEAQTKSKERIERLAAEYGLSSEGPYRFKARITTNIGDYDFENNRFSFDAFPADYLEENYSYRTQCYDATEASGYIERPAPIPRQYRVFFTNENVIQFIDMEMENAGTLIDGMTANGNATRNVAFEFVFEVESGDYTFYPNARYTAHEHIAMNSRIVYAQVRYDRDRNPRNGDEVLIAEYPESFFAD